MARSAATDPLRNFKFRVSIEPPAGGDLSGIISGISSLGFSVVSGLTVQNEMIAYREGGMNTHPHKMVGQSDYGPVTLTKGVFAGQDQLYKWQQFLHSWTQGADGTGTVEGSTREDNDYRCDVVVAVYDHPISAGSYQDPPANAIDMGPAKIAYKLFNCWPASFSMGDLNAGDSSILIQQLVLNHEGFMLSFDSAAETLVSSAN